MVKNKYKGKPADGKHNNPAYAAMVETVDAGVGRIMNKLDELMLTENTVVIFFSDNGGVGGITDMSPLRGSKGMLYEGGIREPMIVEFFEDGHLELYNLDKDISESNNLAEQMPEQTKSLHKKLLNWRAKTNAPVPSELNPDYNPE